MYNLTNITDATDIYGLMSGVNQVSNSFLGIFILFIVFLVSFAFQREHDVRAFIVSSFIASFIGVGFYFIHWISLAVMFLPLLFLIASIIFILFGYDN